MQSITKRIRINSSYLIQYQIELIHLVAKVDWGDLRSDKWQKIKLIQKKTLT